eukprot:7376144-Prymnesium_polylepis.1
MSAPLALEVAHHLGVLGRLPPGQHQRVIARVVVGRRPLAVALRGVEDDVDRRRRRPEGELRGHRLLPIAGLPLRAHDEHLAVGGEMRVDRLHDPLSPIIRQLPVSARTCALVDTPWPVDDDEVEGFD